MSEPSAPSSDPSADAGRWGVTFRALRHRNYRLYFIGQLVSITGSWVQFTAQAWLAWELTRYSRWPAFVSAAQVFPTFVLGLWGGSLADRVPKRLLILTTQACLLALALLLGVLTMAGQMTEWRLLALAGLAGLVTAIDLPARLAFVNEMVGRDDLINAVALNALVFNSARAVGPAVAAVLLETLGPGPCFLVNAATYAAVLLALAAMRPSPWAAPPPRAGAGLSDALRFVSSRPEILLLLCLTGCVAACGWPVLALLPALAERQLDGGKATYGTLVSAVGVGALLGSLLVATYGSRAPRRHLLGAGVLMAIAAIGALVAARSFPLAAAAAVLLGAGLILFLATAQGTVQLTAADHNRGRIMGLWSMVLCGAQPLGNLLSGAAADRWGVAAALAGQAGALTVAASLLLALWWLLRRTPG